MTSMFLLLKVLGFFFSSMQIFSSCLFCIDISCHVVNVKGTIPLWWVMFALIGSASQHATASIRDAQPQIIVGKEETCSSALHLSDLSGDWWQQATRALLAFYLRHSPCCGHTAVSDLTFASYLFIQGNSPARPVNDRYSDHLWLCVCLWLRGNIISRHVQQ